MPAPVGIEACSKWYGQVLGISEISLTIDRGIVGLLGPNGAGKSTLMKILAGIISPSRGRALVHGESPRDSTPARRRIGYCPEHEGVYDELTAREFVTVLARLSGLGPKPAASRAEEALVELGLKDALDRRIGGFSKGMRQRTKLAQAFVHDPDVLLLDEPLTGCDPIARTSIVDKIKRLGADGKTVIISSHVLYEIETLTQDIIVIYRGQVLAEGNIYRIRELIDRHPHRVRVECETPRVLAQNLVALTHIARVQLGDTWIEVETQKPDLLYDALPKIALERRIKIWSLTSPDNNLQAVFEYLTASGGAR